MLYFAYGSNMNEDELTEIDVKILRAEKAILRGYKIALTHNAITRKGGTLDILYPEGNTVEGVLYEIRDGDKGKIDKKEGVKSGAYRKMPEPLSVVTAAGIVKNGVISYEVCKKISPPCASKEYKDSVLRGACEHGLSEEYRAKLKEVLEKREI